MSVGAWLSMGLLWVAMLALIVWLVVPLLPSVNRPIRGADPQPPEVILDRWLARGEIDEQTPAAQRTALATTRDEQDVGSRLELAVDATRDPKPAGVDRFAAVVTLSPGRE
ncbi:hypothetical protein ACFY2T_13120 [Streptomyces sp. NPDC001260]|uniref:hypothetical protein n=1 Tax=Streptomyces sp. NPDC001260 TaxID=3364551 RepID=UPI0036A1F78B